jgi:hypothetical protein
MAPSNSRLARRNRLARNSQNCPCVLPSDVSPIVIGASAPVMIKTVQELPSSVQPYDVVTNRIASDYYAAILRMHIEYPDGTVRRIVEVFGKMDDITRGTILAMFAKSAVVDTAVYTALHDRVSQTCSCRIFFR